MFMEIKLCTPLTKINCQEGLFLSNSLPITSGSPVEKKLTDRQKYLTQHAFQHTYPQRNLNL